MDPEIVVSGNTLEELKRKCRHSVDEGVASIKRYNEMCAQGRDDDFGVPGSHLVAMDTRRITASRAMGMSALTLASWWTTAIALSMKTAIPFRDYYTLPALMQATHGRHQLEHARRLFEFPYLHRRALYGDSRADRRHDT